MKTGNNGLWGGAGDTGTPLRSRAVIAASHARLLTDCGDLAPWGYKHDLDSNVLVLRNQVVTWRRKGERKAYKG